MRVTDRSLQENYLINYQATKNRLKKIQNQITTQSKINKPSDDPLGNSKVMRLNTQLESIEMYKSNIDSSTAVLSNTLTSMEGIQKSVDDVVYKLTSVMNSTADPVLTDFGNQIDQILSTIYDYANYEYDGNYLFAGTNMKAKPFTFDTNKTVMTVANDIGGERKVNISTTATQKINITGEELFQTVIKNFGNINSATANGADTPAAPINTTLYNADGRKFNMAINYNKNAANDYDLHYVITDVADPNYNPVPPPAAVNIVGDISNLVFNSTTGELTSVNGSTNLKGIRIQDAGSKLDFVIDPTGVTEKASATSITTEKTQDSNIFNILVAIRDGLKSGVRPNSNQVALVKNFNKHIVGKLAEGGNIKNRFDSTTELLENQDLELTDLVSKEKDIDMAKKAIELQTEQFNLNTVYKVSSMILPKSLLDYI